MPAIIYYYSLREEIANTLTHGAGFFIAMGGILVLLIAAPLHGGLELSAFLIYGCSLLFMYVASVMYHATRHAKRKVLFRKFDHCAIYLLIAGTYTPLMIIAVNTLFGYVLLGVIWFLAIAGILLKCFTLRSFYGLSLILYALMGWLCVCCITSLFRGMSSLGFAFLVGGGGFYTLGIIFYLINRPYSHTIWHLFVMAGSLLHFLAICMLFL